MVNERRGIDRNSPFLCVCDVVVVGVFGGKRRGCGVDVGAVELVELDILTDVEGVEERAVVDGDGIVGARSRTESSVKDIRNVGMLKEIDGYHACVRIRDEIVLVESLGRIAGRRRLLRAGSCKDELVSRCP